MTSHEGGSSLNRIILSYPWLLIGIVKNALGMLVCFDLFNSFRNYFTSVSKSPFAVEGHMLAARDLRSGGILYRVTSVVTQLFFLGS